MAKRKTSKARTKRTEIYMPPSGAHQWSVCTAQPWFILDNQDDLPDDSSTDASEDGVLAHALSESKINGTKPPSGKITSEMDEYTDLYVAWLEEIYEASLNEKNQRYTELKVPPFYAPHRNCYLDFVSVHADAEGYVYAVNICDLKYGKWPVDVEENEQLGIYARSFCDWLAKHEDEYQFCEVTVFNLYIYQPRVADEPVRGPWTLAFGEMMEWSERKIGAVVKDIRAKKNLKFAPDDDRCHFCPGALLCTARGDNLFSLEVVESGIPQIQEVATIATAESFSKERLFQMLPYVKPLTKFLEDVQELCRQYGERGLLTDDDDYKMVKGKGGRHWTDTTDAINALSLIFEPCDLWTQKLKSPAQVEEMLKLAGVKQPKKLISTLFTHYEGRLLLAPKDDPRPAVQLNDTTQLSDEDAASLL